MGGAEPGPESQAVLCLGHLPSLCKDTVSQWAESSQRDLHVVPTLLPDHSAKARREEAAVSSDETYA